MKKVLVDGQQDDTALSERLQERRIVPVLPAGVFGRGTPRAAARRWAARLNRQEVNRSLYRRRRTTIEPHFGLDKKPFEDHVVWFYGLANNRTHQALLTFVIQVLMIDNFEHGRPPEEIQWLLDAAA